jgi:hypothetical protein
MYIKYNVWDSNEEVSVNTFLYATVYMFLHNLLNVLVQNANKMGLNKEGPRSHRQHKTPVRVIKHPLSLYS